MCFAVHKVHATSIAVLNLTFNAHFTFASYTVWHAVKIIATALRDQDLYWVRKVQQGCVVNVIFFYYIGDFFPRTPTRVCPSTAGVDRLSETQYMQLSPLPLHVTLSLTFLIHAVIYVWMKSSFHDYFFWSSPCSFSPVKI